MWRVRTQPDARPEGVFELRPQYPEILLWLILIKIKSRIETPRKTCTRLCRLNIHGQISHNQTGFVRFPVEACNKLFTVNHNHHYITTSPCLSLLSRTNRLYVYALLRRASIAVKKSFGGEERNEKVSPQIMFKSIHARLHARQTKLHWCLEVLQLIFSQILVFNIQYRC